MRFAELPEGTTGNNPPPISHTGHRDKRDKEKDPVNEKLRAAKAELGAKQQEIAHEIGKQVSAHDEPEYISDLDRKSRFRDGVSEKPILNDPDAEKERRQLIDKDNKAVDDAIKQKWYHGNDFDLKTYTKPFKDLV